MQITQGTKGQDPKWCIRAQRTRNRRECWGCTCGNTGMRDREPRNWEPRQEYAHNKVAHIKNAEHHEISSQSINQSTYTVRNTSHEHLPQSRSHWQAEHACNHELPQSCAASRTCLLSQSPWITITLHAEHACIHDLSWCMCLFLVV